LRFDVDVSAENLLYLNGFFNHTGGVSEAGLRSNVRVGIQYLESWLRGNGAAAIANLMEDAATAEIARAQVWQWRHHGVALPDGRRVTDDLVRHFVDEEYFALRSTLGEESFAAGRFAQARALFERVALEEPFLEFLTLPAYEVVA